LWFFGLEAYGIPLFLALMFLIFVLMKDVMPSIPLFMNALFMVSNTDWTIDGIPLYLYLTPVAIILGIIIHVIRFKVRFFKGGMLIGIVVMFVAMILSSFNAPVVNLNYIFYAAIGLLYALIYFFYTNSLEGDHKEYLLRMFFILGVLISVQTLIFYLRVDDVLLALENKQINLGWGISNYVATYLIMFIPATFYFAKKVKINTPFVIIAVFEIIMLIFTLSRGGMVAFAGVLVLLMIYLFSKNNWKASLVNLLIISVVSFLIVYFNYDAFLAIYVRLKELMLSDTGRIDIWKDALQKFLEHPLFGGGIFARTSDVADYRMYHNTLLHTLATFGILGVISLLIQVWQMFKIVLKKFDSMSAILAISLIGAHAHGMVDNIYFMPQFMILLFIVIAVCENANKFPSVDNDQVIA
jgi:O-antigen ligase